jgi:signal transduction histidine kinase
MAEIPPDRANWLEVIDRNAERLLRLVEDLLLTAQASAGSLALDKADLDVAAVIEQAVQAGAPVAAARGIALSSTTEPLPLANGDRLRIGQVVDNLISNALKFTPQGGRVEVRSYRHNGALRIEVADTGMGVPEAEQDHLFERFFRTARAQEEAIPGVGLGLSIAKAIIEAHDGRISMRSAEGVGTTFCVDLPIATPAIRSISAA